MLRDKLGRSVENGEQNHGTETLSGGRLPEEPSGSEGRNLNQVEPENQQPPESRQDQVRPHNRRLTQENSEEEAETRPTAVRRQGPRRNLGCIARPKKPSQVTSPRAGIDPWPTHLHLFRSQEECRLVTMTHMQLQHSGYYWGAITMEEAHCLLADTPQGTFLIRDSCQPDVFFTLSYQDDGSGPTSVRILLTDLLFSLDGSRKTFASLFALLGFYVGCFCKLRRPLRRQRPELLQQLCRRAVMFTHGAEDAHTLPGINRPTGDYLQAYPYSI